MSRRGVVVLFFFFFFFESLLEVSSLPPGNGHNFQSYKNCVPNSSHKVEKEEEEEEAKKEKTFVGRRPVLDYLCLSVPLCSEKRVVFSSLLLSRVKCGVFRREYYYSKREKTFKKKSNHSKFFSPSFFSSSLIFRVSQKRDQTLNGHMSKRPLHFIVYSQRRRRRRRRRRSERSEQTRNSSSFYSLFPMTTTTTTTVVDVFETVSAIRAEVKRQRRRRRRQKKRLCVSGREKDSGGAKTTTTTGDDEEEEEEAKIGFVATMGGLHRGHVSLIEIALERSDFVVVSVYVNPMQFAPNEDFEAYPRTLKEDVEKIASLKENHRVCVFAPKESLFGKGMDPSECARVSVPNVSRGLCATTRPHFFGGVATVVLKLLNIVKPDVAVFGRKDYQQLKVIEKMVRDLNVDVEILSGDTVREPVNEEASDADACPGLAMSSRNTYLTEKAKKQAEAISVALKDVADGISGRSDEFTPAIGAHMAQGWVGFIKRCIELSGGKVDYVEIRQRETLEGPVEKLVKGEKYVVLACAYFGGVRLLDNVEVDKA